MSSKNDELKYKLMLWNILSLINELKNLLMFLKIFVEFNRMSILTIANMQYPSDRKNKCME
jgi:hypothetical protein